MLFTLLVGGVAGFFLWEMLRPDCIYRSKPGRLYYTKKWIFHILLFINSRRTKHKDNTSVQKDRTQRGYGKSVQDPQLLDLCQPLENHPFAIDSTYFNGFDSDGTSVALRIARKHNREGELWVLLNIPEVGFLQHPIHPDTAVYNMGTNEYKAAGCSFNVIEPLRMWKVTYNGLLRRGPCNEFESKPENCINVKMSFKWECLNDPFNFDVDLCKDLLADAIAREKWSIQFWKMLKSKHQTHYEQCGELSGTIEVEGYPAKQVYLKSFRDHTFGVRNWKMFNRYAVHYIWVEEIGVMAMVVVLWMPDYITFLKSGYIMYANGDTCPVTDVGIDLVDLTKDRIPPEKYSFTFKAGDEEYHVDVSTTVSPEVYHYQCRSSRIIERFCTYAINSLAARGLVEYHYRNPDGPPISTPPPQTISLLVEPSMEEVECHKVELTLRFEDKMCQSSLLVGGKGAQLGMLTSIQEQVDGIVPKGFCLTLSAFELQIQKYPELENWLDIIVSSIRKGNMANLPKDCANVVALMSSCEVCQPIRKQIISEMHAVFSKACEEISLAVRSSAAGEDGDESSSAGQMETYLGVRGINQILEAVRTCWASAFTFQAVEYRRLHGQPVRTSVGVVIQQMVAAEAAGVLFTNEPLSGSPNKMVIDASFGLGEVVVSGKTTPDTFVIQRHFDNRLQILERKIGDKAVMITMSASGGTQEIKSGSSKQCCLSDEQILRLSLIGIRIEEMFGSPRDIEWAIQNDKFFLLQARPITTFLQETDKDLMHEFDTPIATGKERITLGNVGEMMPGCITPLTGSVFARAAGTAVSMVAADFGGCRVVKNGVKVLIFNCSRLFMNITYVSQIHCNSLLYDKSAMEMNLMGQLLKDHTLEMIRSYGMKRGNFFSRLLQVLKFFSANNRKIKKADQWCDKVKSYNIGLTCQTSKELYQEIDSKLSDFYENWECSVQKSARSGSWGGVVMAIVSGGKEAWTVDNYSDVALLLSQCSNVYSAEVPLAIKDIARSIVQSENEETFLNMTDHDCIQFLNSDNCPKDLHIKFQSFMERHGHRCVREAEFIEKSWRAEPEKLIKVIKVILKSQAYMETQQTVLNLDEAIAHLKSPVTPFGRFLLRKWIVKKARAAVCDRELGKSVAVDVSDRFKQAYWRLADMLYLEGRIPERELMFFLTHYEIGQLIKTSSSRLVTKAMRRQKILPMQSAMKFQHLYVGRPVPIVNKTDEIERKSSFKLKGMPVSHGTVKGMARVVKSLEEANLIQKGDILIVSYTDIGWSPYFPLLSGLVTELGGLISHGAVVAREYGLPCVVNVPGATETLHTGDMIYLDGGDGIIEKLEDKS